MESVTIFPYSFVQRLIAFSRRYAHLCLVIATRTCLPSISLHLLFLCACLDCVLGDCHTFFCFVYHYCRELTDIWHLAHIVCGLFRMNAVVRLSIGSLHTDSPYQKLTVFWKFLAHTHGCITYELRWCCGSWPCRMWSHLDLTLQTNVTIWFGYPVDLDYPNGVDSH